MFFALVFLAQQPQAPPVAIDWLHVVLGILAVVLPIFAPWIVNKVRDKNPLAGEMLEAVITGIEHHAAATGDGSAKSAVRNEALAQGLETELGKIVEKVTAAIPPTEPIPPKQDGK